MCKPLFRSATTQLDDEECDDNYEEPGTRVVMFHGPALSAQDILHFGTPRARFRPGTFRAPHAPLDLLPLLPLGLCPFGRVRRWLQSVERPRRLVPILLYLDGAVTGQFDHLQVESMKITLGVFDSVARDREHAWRTIGYCPNYTKSESKGKKILEESLHTAAHLHPVEDDEGLEEEVSEVDVNNEETGEEEGETRNK